MTRLRATIAKRLLDAQHNSAMLTTFNEVNMKPLMDLRKAYKEQFEKTHNGTRLGFMGFFVKAATEALKRFPRLTHPSMAMTWSTMASTTSVLRFQRKKV